MKISAKLYKSKSARGPHPVFTIDDIPLDVWLNEMTNESTVLDLVPAQGWLDDEDEFELSWNRLECLEPDTCTFVPILICSDDVDFTCAVVIVEQSISMDTVIWNRFGWNLSSKKEVGSTIRWFKTQVSVSFHIVDFRNAFEKFRILLEDTVNSV